jgi:hypothetical protein
VLKPLPLAAVRGSLLLTEEQGLLYMASTKRNSPLFTVFSKLPFLLSVKGSFGKKGDKTSLAFVLFFS